MVRIGRDIPYSWDMGVKIFYFYFISIFTFTFIISLLSSSGPGPGTRSGPGQVPGQVRKVQGLRTKDLDLGYTRNLVCHPPLTTTKLFFRG